MLLTILLRHPSTEACLGELRRNDALRRLIGITSESQVPKKWNMSRFQAVLGTVPHRSLLRDVFDAMVQRLGAVVPDLGVHTAGDASGLNARRDRRKNPPDSPDGLPAPAGGRQEYTDEAGKVVKVVEWFGYKFHLLVDDYHEVILAYRVSSTKHGDNEELPALVAQAQANLPACRMNTLAYDKASDDNKVHRVLHDARIKPVIQNRSLTEPYIRWTGEHERLLPGHDGNTNIVYDESGTVYCYDKVSEPAVRHRMAYIGHEASRGTLKYRCPAMHEGWSCPSHRRCNARKRYGLTVRVKQEIDLRRFPPIPWATKRPPKPSPDPGGHSRVLRPRSQQPAPTRSHAALNASPSPFAPFPAFAERALRRAQDSGASQPVAQHLNNAIGSPLPLSLTLLPCSHPPLRSQRAQRPTSAFIAGFKLLGCGRSRRGVSARASAAGCRLGGRAALLAYGAKPFAEFVSRGFAFRRVVVVVLAAGCVGPLPPEDAADLRHVLPRSHERAVAAALLLMARFGRLLLVVVVPRLDRCALLAAPADLGEYQRLADCRLPAEQPASNRLPRIDERAERRVRLG